MSMKAVVWAIEQPDLSHGEFRVLMSLANRHNPDLGCFPSVSRLTDDCNMSRSSVFTNLTKLEKKGIIKRVGRVRSDGQQTSNEYTLYLDGGVQILDGGSPNSGRRGVQILDTNNLVSINHVIKPNMFNDAWNAYPRKIGKGNALKAWARAIKKIDEAELCKILDQYIESLVGKDQQYTPHLSTWLNGERWHDDIEKSRKESIDQGFRDMVNDLARVNR